MSKPYIIGIDGGGSKTEAASTEINGKLIKRHTTGSININMVGEEIAITNLLSCIEAVKMNDKAEICIIGAAGMENEKNRRRILDAVNGKYAKRTILVSDAKISYKTIGYKDNGIILICGTGSIAYTEINGTAIRAGGWGYIVGDEGSGFWIARKAINNMLKAYDEGMEEMPLTRIIMKYYNITKPPQIIEKIYGEPRRICEIAKLAERIAEACEEGDKEAEEIIVEAGMELAKLAKKIIKRTMMKKGEVYCFGGLFKTSKKILKIIEREIKEEYPEIEVLKCKFRGIAGAIIMGMESMGIKISDEIILNLEEWAGEEG
ncbi:MAG: BadF/BadG/BcrA/BcrD ATPase family protein [Candidatus Methanomethylicia archaeon]